MSYKALKCHLVFMEKLEVLVFLLYSGIQSLAKAMSRHTLLLLGSEDSGSKGNAASEGWYIPSISADLHIYE